MRSKSPLWVVGGFLLLCLCIAVVSAGTIEVMKGVIDWQKALGGTGTDIPYSVHQTSDGGYILTGYTESSSSGDVGVNHGNRDVWVVKTDAAGSIQWQRVLGSTGGEESFSINQTTDGGYILTGYTDGWATEDVGYGGWGGTQGSTSLVFDASGNPHISYCDSDAHTVVHAYKNGGDWTTEIVESGVSGYGQYTSMAFDSSGRLHISYMNDGLKHAVKIGTSWSITTVDPDAYSGAFSSLKMDPFGNPSISYFTYPAPDSKLKYANYDSIESIWVKDDVATITGQSAGYTSLAFDGGIPHISYYTLADGLKIAWKDLGVWHTEPVDSTGRNVNSLAFDPDHNPHITYTDTSYRLKHAWRSAGIWSTETVDSSGGQFSSLAFINGYDLHVSYEAGGRLKHAWKSGGIWSKETVDSTGSGWYTSLAFDASGNAHISYFDMNIPGGGLTYGLIKHAWWQPHSQMDVWVVKLDSTGTIQWQKVLEGNNWEDGYDIKQTSDGGYVLLGRTTSSGTGDVGFSHGGIDFWVVKLNSAGVIQWQKPMGGSGDDQGMGIQQTSDGGYILAGTSTSTDLPGAPNNGGIDIWVVKLNSAGGTTWTKSLGGSGDDFTWRIYQTSDGGYITAGWTTSSSTGDVGPNHGDNDVWVVKLTSTGDITWQKVLGGSGFDIGKDVKQTSDGGYIIVGTTGSSNSGDVGPNHGNFDTWIVKLNSAGTIQWQNVTGGSDYENGESIQQTSDQGYIVTGFTSSNNNGDVGPSHGGADYWLVKLHENQGILPGPVYDAVKGHVGGSFSGKSMYAGKDQVGPSTLVNGWSSDVTLAAKKGWFVFIDDFPGANWEHPCRYLHIDDSVSPPKVTEYPASSPPKNIVITFIDGVVPNPSGTNDIGGGGGITLGITSGGSSTCNMDCSDCYALLLSGGYDKDNNNVRYWDDISSMYKTLRQTYCYPAENIYVLMSDGPSNTGDDQFTGLNPATGAPTYANSKTDLNDDGIAEVYGDATRSTLEQTLSTLRNKLLADDTLFIFTTNHGGKVPGTNNVRLWLWNQQSITDEEFTSLLQGFPAKTITMTMEQCYSGGFVEEFINYVPQPPLPPQTRVIATAASAEQPSYGNDFSYWWINGVAGSANSPPSGNGDKLISLRESFDYAKTKDPSALAGLETPQYSGGVSGDAGLTLALSSCAKCPAPGALPGGITPTDANGDGIYENLNGDQVFDIADVVLYFNNMEWIAANGPVCAFDTNGNGRIDFVDVVNLYGRAQ